MDIYFIFNFAHFMHISHNDSFMVDSKQIKAKWECFQKSK